VFVIDWHLDLAWNALEWDRDLTRPLAEIRRREAESGQVGPGRGTGTVSLAAMRAGGVGIAAATLLARHDRERRMLDGIPRSGYISAEAAHASATGQLAYYRALERRGWVTVLTDWPAFEAHARLWQDHAQSGRPVEEAPPVGLVISMEGADPILEPDDVDEWWDAGLRVVGLSHYGNGRYSHGTDSPGPLHPPADALLRGMERRGMILDVTHLADEAMDQVFDKFGGVVLASHHNCRALVDHQRQLRDEDIRRIVERGGVIGAAMDNWMLDPCCGQTGTDSVRRAAALGDVVDHIDHVCQVAGSAGHAAIGTDLDGGFGAEQSPLGLDTIADLQKIPDLLERRGYAPADVEGIMHGNWLDLIRRAWADQ
jgi:membrane dipeptidase